MPRDRGSWVLVLTDMGHVTDKLEPNAIHQQRQQHHGAEPTEEHTQDGAQPKAAKPGVFGQKQRAETGRPGGMHSLRLPRADRGKTAAAIRRAPLGRKAGSAPLPIKRLRYAKDDGRRI